MWDASDLYGPSDDPPVYQALLTRLRRGVIEASYSPLDLANALHGVEAGHSIVTSLHSELLRLHVQGREDTYVPITVALLHGLVGDDMLTVRRKISNRACIKKLAVYDEEERPLGALSADQCAILCLYAEELIVVGGADFDFKGTVFPRVLPWLYHAHPKMIHQVRHMAAVLASKSAAFAKSLVKAHFATEFPEILLTLRLSNNCTFVLDGILDHIKDSSPRVADALLLLGQILDDSNVAASLYQHSLFSATLNLLMKSLDLVVVLRAAYAICIAIPVICREVAHDHALAQIFNGFLRVALWASTPLSGGVDETTQEPSDFVINAVKAATKSLFLTLYGVFPFGTLTFIRGLKAEQRAARTAILAFCDELALHPQLLLDSKSAEEYWNRDASEITSNCFLPFQGQQDRALGRLKLQSSMSSLNSTQAESLPTWLLQGAAPELLESAQLQEPDVNLSASRIDLFGPHVPLSPASSLVNLSKQLSFDESEVEKESPSPDLSVDQHNDTLETPALLLANSTGLDFTSCQRVLDNIEHLYVELASVRAEKKPVPAVQNEASNSLEVTLLKSQLVFETVLQNKHKEEILRLRRLIAQPTASALNISTDLGGKTDDQRAIDEISVLKQTHEKQLRELMARLQKAEEKNIEISEALAAQANVRFKADDNARLKDQVDRLQGQLNQAKDCEEKLRAKLASQEESLSQLASVTSKLKEQEAAFPARDAVMELLKASRGREHQASLHIFALQKDLESLKRADGQQERLVRELRQDLAESERELKEQAQSMETLKQHLERSVLISQSEMQAVESKYTSLKRINGAVQARLVDLQLEIESLRAELANARAEVSASASQAESASASPQRPS